MREYDGKLNVKKYRFEFKKNMLVTQNPLFEVNLVY